MDDENVTYLCGLREDKIQRVIELAKREDISDISEMDDDTHPGKYVVLISKVGVYFTVTYEHPHYRVYEKGGVCMLSINDFELLLKLFAICLDAMAKASDVN